MFKSNTGIRSDGKKSDVSNFNSGMDEGFTQADLSILGITGLLEFS